VLIRKSSSLNYLDTQKIKVFYGEVTDFNSLVEATKDIDVVIHLASLIHPVNVPDSMYYDVNVTGATNVLKAVKENNPKLKQFIHCSSVTVYGEVDDVNVPITEDIPLKNQTTIYGVTKYKAELALKKLAEELNVPLTIVRPARIYGERDTSFDSMILLMKKKLFFNIGEGNTFMHPIYVKDCVEGIINSICNKKSFDKAYNLAGPEVINKKDFLRILSKHLGKKFPEFNIPIFVVKSVAIINEALFKPFNKDPFVSRKKLAFFLGSNKYDISAAKRDLGYEPKVGIDEGLRRMVEWYNNRKN
jgi:nucleoside-diphosphate-sugar epimerase